MVIEMPVLDAAMVACGLAFLPALVAMKYGTVGMRVVQAGARAVPRGVLPLLPDLVLDVVRQDPGPSASVLEGLFFGRIAPPRRERVTLRQPALIIGHRRDPVHPFDDAGMLADELPGARLLEASSILELRLAPRRLTDAIADFVDECWRPAAASPAAATASAVRTALSFTLIRRVEQS
jgi:pimeloyl-ACP methyl ester carboxylesterase